MACLAERLVWGVNLGAAGSFCQREVEHFRGYH